MSAVEEDAFMADLYDTAQDQAWPVDQTYSPSAHGQQPYDASSDMTGIWPQLEIPSPAVSSTRDLHKAPVESLLDRIEPRDHIDWEPLKPLPLGPASWVSDRDMKHTEIVLSENQSTNHSEYHPDRPFSPTVERRPSQRREPRHLPPRPRSLTPESQEEDNLVCCGRTFSDSMAIYQHQAMKHFDDLMCYLCERHFPHSGAAKNHMQVKHPMLYARTYRGDMFSDPSLHTSHPPPRYREPYVSYRTQGGRSRKKGTFSVTRSYNFSRRQSSRW